MTPKPLLIALSIFACTALARGDIAPEKRTEIDRMLKVTGMEKLADQMMHQLIAGMQTSNTNVPQAFWDRFTQKVHASEMIELIVPLYDKYYSLEDLRALNAFYSSPAGQRMLSTLPQIMQESVTIGQRWGEKVAQEAVEELRAEMKKKELESDRGE